MRLNLNRLKAVAIISMLFMVMFLSYVAAVTEPEGPSTLTGLTWSRRAARGPNSIAAVAGNITSVNVVGKTVTQSWQGYVGNVSGTITLDDSSNYTLYDWALASPSGEIYATNSTSVTWTTGNVECWHGTGAQNNKATMNGIYGIGNGEVDSINATFLNATDHDAFYAGGQYIYGGGCFAVQLYNGTRENVFQEVLLYDDTANNIVFTSLLKNNVNGYNNQTWDFEMIVAENGHSGDVATSLYYFYVELQ